MKGSTTLWLSAVLTLLLCYSPASAQTTILVTATKDNTLFENATGGLSNGSGDHLFIGLTGGNAGNTLRRALVFFDVAGNVPAGATITNAELSIDVTRSRGGTLPASMHRLTQDWGEGLSDAPGQEGAGALSENNDATWLHTFYPNSTWSTPGGDFNAAASSNANIGSGAGTFAGLASDVQDMLDNPANNFGWIILGDEAASRGAKRFDGIGTIIPRNKRTVLSDTEILQALPGLSITYSGLPVELTDWNAKLDNGIVHFSWSTLSESDNSGFEIQRDSGHGFELIGFIQGQGESQTRQDYEFELNIDKPGRHQFRLKQVDFSGGYWMSPVVEITVDLPEAIYLSNGYPNPFNPSVNFDIGLAESGPLQVDVFDSLGRHVKELINTELSASEIVNVRFEADTTIPSGNYFVFARSENLVQIQKVTLQK